MLIALPTGRRSGDKFDTRATAPKAPVAASTEAGAPQACTQAVPTTGGEGVATAPTETQASSSKAAATSVATGNRGGNYSCRKRGDMVRTKSRREDTGGVLACAPKSWGRDCGQIGWLLGSFQLPHLHRETAVLCLSLLLLALQHRRGFPPSGMAPCFPSATQHLSFLRRTQ